MNDFKPLDSMELKVAGYVFDSQLGVTNTPSESGIKYDADKPRTDLIPALALMEVAKVMAFGAKKYGDYNWKGGLKFSRLIAACLRHVYLYLSGESLDSETGLSHIAHACCCLLMLLDFIISGRNSLDDRYKENKNETK